MKIQATTKKSLISSVKTKVAEGATYEFENVLVTHNDPKYQTTSHRYKLNLLPNTSWKMLDENVIPVNHFDFANFKDILAAEKEGSTLVTFCVVGSCNLPCIYIFHLYGDNSFINVL